MSEKKRKALKELHGQSSKKKSHTAAPSSTVRIRYLRSAAIAKPVIAASPGITFPANIAFKLFAKTTPDASELLLHSSDHPTIDFTATEGGTYADSQLKHYVATYDPISGQLDIIEARKMTVRGTVRQVDPEERREEDEGEEALVEPVSNFSSRSALTQAFGTKKSKKLVQSRAENVLYSRDADPSAGNPLSEALLSAVPETETLATDPDGQLVDSAAAIQAAKPLPTPDLTATDVSHAYPLSNLVFPSPYTTTLAAIPTTEWRTLVSSGKRVNTISRYVAYRLALITQRANTHSSPDSPETTILNLLRYILLLIELSRGLSRHRPGKRLPPTAKWLPTSGITDHDKIPAPLLRSLIETYSPQSTGPTKHSLQLLHTTILALTLHIPPPSGKFASGVLATDPTDIQQDLNLQADQARLYFRELGCKIEAATEKELRKWGLKQRLAEGENQDGVVVSGTKYAKLRVPLVFPKVGRGAPVRGRGR